MIWDPQALYEEEQTLLQPTFSVIGTMSLKRAHFEQLDVNSAKKQCVAKQCGCGCDNSSIWGCYNSSSKVLSEDIKSLKISPSVENLAKSKFSLEFSQVEGEWMVNDNDFESIDKCLDKLKPSEDFTELVEEYKMLEACDEETLPLRALHYVHTYASMKGPKQA